MNESFGIDGYLRVSISFQKVSVPQEATGELLALRLTVRPRKERKYGLHDHGTETTDHSSPTSIPLSYLQLSLHPTTVAIGVPMANSRLLARSPLPQCLPPLVWIPRAIRATLSYSKLV